MLVPDTKLNTAFIFINKKLSYRRDRATIRVIEYFVRSLKAIQNDTVE